ncbi:MAG: hypothetical protein ACJ72B_05100 [Ornithinibacter sp.]
MWIFAGLMIGGVALGALLILIRPRDDEAAAWRGRQRLEAQAWLHGRADAIVSRMPSRPERASRQ